MAGDHRKALEAICQFCFESSSYTRRIQLIHNTAMVALGMTQSQRDHEFNQVMISRNRFKSDLNGEGWKEAKKAHIKFVELLRREHRARYEASL